MRLQNIYGTKFEAQFPDERTLALAKREWCMNIWGMGKKKLDDKLEHVKRMSGKDSQLDWPNIGYILSLHTGNSPDGTNSQAYVPYKPALPDWAAKARARTRGEQELAKLKALLL